MEEVESCNFKGGSRGEEPLLQEGALTHTHLVHVLLDTTAAITTFCCRHE